MKLRLKKANLLLWCLVLAVFTLVAYNGKFFRHFLARAGEAPAAAPDTLSTVLFLLAALFLLYLLLAYLGRRIGRWLIALSFLVSAITLYSLNMYNAVITEATMGSTFGSRYSELSSYITPSYVLYGLLLGLLPALYAAFRRVDYGSWKRFFAAAGVALLLSGGLFALNRPKQPWIASHEEELGGLLMPWCWAAHTLGHFCSAGTETVHPLPDASCTDDSPDVCVLVIGESARRDHFSLFGYERRTNPLLEADSVAVLPVRAANTYTIACLREMLAPFRSDQLYEALPSYLQRSGVDVRWRTSNWGEPPLHVGRYESVRELKQRFPAVDTRYDECLLAGLKEEILGSSGKLLIVIHTYTNHGPDYRANYPPAFERFLPVGDTRRLSRTDPALIRNAYDNCMLYTDYLLHSVIDSLRAIPDRRCCMLYMADHGESLGENGHYLHAAPLSIAPAEQLGVPLIVWSSDKRLKIKDMGEIEPYSLFHSLLRFYGLSTPVFDEAHCVFEP